MADNKYNSKPGQTLTDIANAEYKKMITKNIYQPNDAETNYSVNHPNATSDGDEKGKGNASYLGVYSDETGSLTDKNERKSLVASNLYNKKKEYYNVTDEAGGKSVGI